MTLFFALVVDWAGLAGCSSHCVPCCCCLQARDALRHVRYGQEGQYCAIFRQLHVQGWFYWCGMNRGTVTWVVDAPLYIPTVQTSPCLQVVQVVHIPVEVQTWLPMVQTFRRTTEVPQLLDMVIDDPIAQVVQFDVFVVVQRRFPMVQTVWLTMVLPQLQLIDKVIDVCCAGRASSTGAVLEETAEFGVSTASCGMKLALVAGRACAQAQGRVLTPAIGAGKGWRGAGSLTPR